MYLEVADVIAPPKVDIVHVPLLERPSDLVADQSLVESHERSATIVDSMMCSNLDIVKDTVGVDKIESAVSYHEFSFFC